MARQYLVTNPDLPFAEAVLVDGKTLYLSGRLGLLPDRSGVPESPEEEAHLLMRDLQRVLTLAEMTLDDLVQLQIHCADVSLWGMFNSVYRQYFTRQLPARAFLGSGPLLFNARFEAIGIAVREETPLA